MRQEIHALTINTHHAEGGVPSQTNKGKGKPISVTPKGTSYIRPFQYTVSNLVNNSQLSQRTNSNPKIAHGNPSNSSHSASILEDSYFKDSNDKRDKTHGHQDSRNKYTESSRDYRDHDDEIFSIRRNSEDRYSSRIISERNDSYTHEDQEKLESPQFVREENRKRQNYEYDNEDLDARSDEEDDEDDEVEPIKVKLDLSAFAKSLQKPVEQPVSYNALQQPRFPSFQPNLQEINLQKNPFTSDYNKRGSKSPEHYERDDEKPRYEQEPERYQFRMNQGRESFQPDAFTRMLSQEVAGYKNGTDGNANQLSRDIDEEDEENSQHMSKENYYFEEDSNIIRKVQQDIKTLSNKMNESLSPSYGKNLQDNLFNKRSHNLIKNVSIII